MLSEKTLKNERTFAFNPETNRSDGKSVEPSTTHLLQLVSVFHLSSFAFFEFHFGSLVWIFEFIILVVVVVNEKE